MEVFGCKMSLGLWEKINVVGIEFSSKILNVNLTGKGPYENKKKCLNNHGIGDTILIVEIFDQKK